MSQELLTVSKDNALKAYEATNAEGKTLLTNLYGKTVFIKDPFLLVTSLETLCEVTATDINSFNPFPVTRKRLSDVNREILELAYEYFNDGWIPDYSNKQQEKWYPWFEYKTGGFVLFSVSHSYGSAIVGSRLCAKNRKIVEHITTHFLKNYNAYLTA